MNRIRCYDEQSSFSKIPVMWVCACACLTRHENQWPKRLEFLCENNETPYPPRESVSQNTWDFYVDWCVMCMVCDVCVRCVLCGVRTCGVVCVVCGVCMCVVCVVCRVCDVWCVRCARGACVYGVWCACVVCVVYGVCRVYVYVCVCGVSDVGVCVCVPYPPREPVRQSDCNFYAKATKTLTRHESQ